MKAGRGGGDEVASAAVADAAVLALMLIGLVVTLTVAGDALQASRS